MFEDTSILTTALTLGPVVSITASLIKMATKKYGAEMGRTVVLSGVFLLSVIFAGITQYGSPVFVDTIIALFGGAIVFYELVIKTLITPALANLSPNK